ncbi:MAG TPA: STAS domain-containing protein [Anaerolineales bacterium]
MIPPLFDVRVRQAPGLAILDLKGEINGSVGPELVAAYAEAVRCDLGGVGLNFTGINYINSTGIALIVGLLAKARQAHQRILAYGLNDHYRELFTITRLVDLMTVFPDETSALNQSNPNRT